MLLDLPQEVVFSVFKSLGVADVVAMGCCCKGLRALVADDSFWVNLAEAKWGVCVQELKQQADRDADSKQAVSPGGDAAAAADQSSKGPGTSADIQEEAPCMKGAAAFAKSGSWMAYCCKRMSLRSISPSPLSLLQEAYQDPWQHIICCVLCSRTSGSTTIRQCIADFFQVFPTPTAVLEASDAAITTLIHPLGLQPSRLAAVKAVSRDFLGTDWQQPDEFKGCGRFVTDSWRIFCKGCRDARGVEDAKLKQYLTWASKQHQEPTADVDQDKTTAAGPECKKRASNAGSSKTRGGAATGTDREGGSKRARPGMQMRAAAARPGPVATGRCTRSRAAAAAAAAAGKAMDATGNKRSKFLQQQSSVRKSVVG